MVRRRREGRRFGRTPSRTLSLIHILGWGTWTEIIDRIPEKCATIEQPSGTPSVWEPQFVRLLHEVEAIYSGAQDYSHGGLYWFDSSKEVTNPWFKERILGDLDVHKKVCDMNSLIVLI